jgi:hypothetical protein
MGKMPFPGAVLRSRSMPLLQPRWILRRDLHDLGRDPMLPRGRDKCWCDQCGLYFNSSGAFAKHLTGIVGTPERRCLSVRQLRNRGWTQTASGHWRVTSMPPDALLRIRNHAHQ